MQSSVIGRRFVIAAVLIGGGAIALMGYANADLLARAPWGVVPASPEVTAIPMAVPDYRTNSEGLTYGSALDAPSVETQPDLILVVATSGQEGYVYRDALEEAVGGDASTPEEMLSFQEQARPTTLPVYEEDGQTEIGEFLVGPHSAN